VVWLVEGVDFEFGCSVSGYVVDGDVTVVVCSENVGFGKF
jgi:hypothetical protein